MKLYRPIFSFPTTLSSKNACASRPSSSKAVTGVSRSARSWRYTGTMSAVCALIANVGRSGKYLRVGEIVAAGEGRGTKARRHEEACHEATRVLEGNRDRSTGRGQRIRRTGSRNAVAC